MIYDKHLGKEFKFSLQKHIYIPVTSYSLDNIDMGNSLICQKNQHDPDQWKYIELIITFSIRQYSNPSHQRPPLLRVLHMEQELLTLPECLSFQLFFICIGGVRVINFVNLHVFSSVMFKLGFLCKNGVRFVFSPIHFVWSSCFINVICTYLHCSCLMMFVSLNCNTQLVQLVEQKCLTFQGHPCSTLILVGFVLLHLQLGQHSNHNEVLLDLQLGQHSNHNEFNTYNFVYIVFQSFTLYCG